MRQQAASQPAARPGEPTTWEGLCSLLELHLDALEQAQQPLHAALQGQLPAGAPEPVLVSAGWQQCKHAVLGLHICWRRCSCCGHASSALRLACHLVVCGHAGRMVTSVDHWCRSNGSSASCGDAVWAAGGCSPNCDGGSCHALHNQSPGIIPAPSKFRYPGQYKAAVCPAILSSFKLCEKQEMLQLQEEQECFTCSGI